MKALLRLDSIKTRCILGLLPAERETPQDVEVIVSLSIDVDDADAASKSTDGTVDWYALANGIETLLKSEKFYLAETAALEIARFTLEHPRVNSARVEVKKFRITPAVGAASITVELARGESAGKTRE